MAKALPPNVEYDVVVEDVIASPSSVRVVAGEEEPTGAKWSVRANAICARAP